MTELAPSVKQDVLAALEGYFPETFWDCQDDACDCVFQRIGMWTNPYLGETLEVRMCCIWAELYKLFPDKVRVIPAYQDGNKGEWVEGTLDWNAEYDMPRAIWYRQMARREGISVEEARKKYSQRDEERPRGRPRPRPTNYQLSLSQRLAIESLAEKMEMLRQQQAAILMEVGCDPDKTYHISPEGVVTEVSDGPASNG